MPFLKSISRLIPHSMRQRLKRRIFTVQDVPARLANIARAGFRCTGAIDGGAFEGEWSREFWRVFPEVPIVLVEPLASKAPMLGILASSNDPSIVVTAALGPEMGTVKFRTAATNSAVVVGTGDAADTVVDQVTIDHVLASNPNLNPNFLKLDLQGYELEALRGCRDVRRFEIILLEVSILRIGEVPIFSEVDARMQQWGFVLYDLVPQYYRPLDGALWQCDAFYVRNDSKLVSSRNWD